MNPKVKSASILLAWAAALASASDAAAGSNLCPASQVCIYTDAKFSGRLGP